MSDERRSDRQPALFRAALSICVTDMTDGFCTPQNAETCKCWQKAEAVMEATGLSGRAVAWMWPRRRMIETEAEKAV